MTVTLINVYVNLDINLWVDFVSLCVPMIKNSLMESVLVEMDGSLSMVNVSNLPGIVLLMPILIIILNVVFVMMDSQSLMENVQIIIIVVSMVS